MGNSIKSKTQIQYLNLIVKKLIKGGLINKDLKSYKLLNISMDPLGNLEKELTDAWRSAEERKNNKSDEYNFESP